MHIKIYQIDHENDKNRVKFESLSATRANAGGIDPAIYSEVFDGDVDCKRLENVYELFNHNHPITFRGHSLSVSDVVEITENSENYQQGCFFCDSVGFEKIDFDTAQTIQPEEKIKVVLVKPMQKPEIVEIGTSLEALQQAVNGMIEEIMPFDEEVAIVVNEEGKIDGLPLNRALKNKKGSLINIIAGDFFICSAKGENFTSLTDEQAQRYCEMFKSPERFYRTADGIKAVPVTPTKNKEYER
jgi:hypothetical protein